MRRFSKFITSSKENFLYLEKIPITNISLSLKTIKVTWNSNSVTCTCLCKSSHKQPMISLFSLRKKALFLKRWLKVWIETDEHWMSGILIIVIVQNLKCHKLCSHSTWRWTIVSLAPLVYAMIPHVSAIFSYMNLQEDSFLGLISYKGSDSHTALLGNIRNSSCLIAFFCCLYLCLFKIKLSVYSFTL